MNHPAASDGELNPRPPQLLRIKALQAVHGLAAHRTDIKCILQN